MSQIQQLREIANQLRELQHTSPTSVADLASWDASARKFTHELHSKHPDVNLPAQVMHYLHDADIRAKDPEYRLAQDKVLDGIIADLEQGMVPAFAGTTISFHPRWLGVAALVLLAILYWAIAA